MKYSELTSAAKERALSDWQQCDISWDSEFSQEDIKETGESLGFNIENVYFSGFSSQGDGCCCTGSYSYKKGALKTLLKDRPMCTELHAIVKKLQDLQRSNFYALRARVTHSGRYSHSQSNNIVVDDTRRYCVSSEAEDDLAKLLRDYMNLAYKWLETDYDFAMSEESFIDTACLNDWDFDENGRIQK